MGEHHDRHGRSCLSPDGARRCACRGSIGSKVMRCSFAATRPPAMLFVAQAHSLAGLSGARGAHRRALRLHGRSGKNCAALGAGSVVTAFLLDTNIPRATLIKGSRARVANGSAAALAQCHRFRGDPRGIDLWPR